jgi:DNA repair exonuclease SbcCD nuclease subunit
VSNFKFVHAADLHLDSPFSSMATIEPSLVSYLKDTSLQAWDSLIDLVLEENAQLLLLAGDNFDSARHGPRAKVRFIQGVERLSAAGVSTCIVCGNHDPIKYWNDINRKLPGLHIFDSSRVESIEVELADNSKILVLGMSFKDSEEMKNLAKLFSREPKDCFHIGLLHCAVGDRKKDAVYAPCSLKDLQNARLDYWALGHVHHYSVLQKEDPCIIYPGCLQGRSSAKAEIGDKGVVVVNCRDGRVDSHKFVSLCKVRFESFELDIRELPDLDSLRTEMTGRLERNCLKVSPSVSWIVRFRLIGRGEMHRWLNQKSNLNELHQMLNEFAPIEGYTTSDNKAFVWVEKLEVDTRPPLDLPSLSVAGTFPAELIARAQELFQNEPERNDFVQTLDQEFTRLVPSRWMPAPPDEAELIEKARDELLDLFLGEDT